MENNNVTINLQLPDTVSDTESSQTEEHELSETEEDNMFNSDIVLCGAYGIMWTIMLAMYWICTYIESQK